MLTTKRGEHFVDQLKKMIRTVPDFPKPGIMFYDITTLLKDAYGLRTTIDRLVECIDDPHKQKRLAAYRVVQAGI